MQPLVKQLYELVSESLYEMTWRCNFPIQPNEDYGAFLKHSKHLARKLNLVAAMRPSH